MYAKVGDRRLLRGMNMVLYDCVGQLVTGAECDLNFMTFVLELWKTPEKPQPEN